MQNVSVPQRDRENIAACEGFIRLIIDGDAHSPRADGIEVARCLVRPLSCRARWQPHRVQPNCRHHILGDLDTAHAVPVGENCRQWNAKGRVPFPWPLERIGMVLEEHRLDMTHEWYIQEIQPEGGFIAVVGMAKPASGWRQHDITGCHIDPLPVYHGVDIISGIGAYEAAGILQRGSVSLRAYLHSNLSWPTSSVVVLSIAP